MSQAFYDSTGRPYAYSDDGLNIFSYSGEPLGYLHEDSVYAFNGTHLGYFEGGAIRDAQGSMVLFTENCVSGPIKPVKQIRPVKGVKQVLPIKGIKQIRPIRPIKGLSWSFTSPEDFFRI